MSKQAMIFRCMFGMCSKEIDPNVGLYCELHRERSKREDLPKEFSKEFLDTQNEISLICILYG